MSRRSNMSKIREILRLKFMEGMTENTIASSVGCSHNTVKSLLAKAAACELTHATAKELDDNQIDTLIYPSKFSAQPVRPEPDLDYIHAELKRRNVTLSLLW